MWVRVKLCSKEVDAEGNMRTCGFMECLDVPENMDTEETAMYRVKQLFGGSLTLRDYDGQVAEAMALVRALNKMTKAGMPESVRIA